MFQVTCIHDRPPAQVHLGPVAVQLKLRIILGTLHMVITLTPVILSVRIKEEKATKVGMPPAPLNPSKALISKSGPPHDHFNWPVMERCAEWLGLARGLFHITYLKRKKKKYIKKIKKKKIYIKKKTEKKRKKKNRDIAHWSWESALDSWDILWLYPIYIITVIRNRFYFQHVGSKLLWEEFRGILILFSFSFLQNLLSIVCASNIEIPYSRFLFIHVF